MSARAPAAGIGAWPAAVLAALLAGCVTRTLEPEAAPALDQRPVLIPLGAAGAVPGGDAVLAYYEDVLRQAQAAVRERDLSRLQELLALHDRDDAPAWARDRLQSYRVLERGLLLEAELAQRASLVLRGDVLAAGEPALGAPFDVVLTIAAGIEARTPANFLLRFQIADTDAFGNRSERRHRDLLAVDRPVDLAVEALRLPVRIELPAGNAVQREIEALVELLPGQTRFAGQQVPLGQRELARVQATLCPVGIERLREKPLATLANAVRMGDPAHFGHVYLAARAMPAADRPAACATLVRWLRLGNSAQQGVALAALPFVADDPPKDADREQWLKWWSRRPATRR